MAKHRRGHNPADERQISQMHTEESLSRRFAAKPTRVIPRIILDLSRLLSRAGRPTPTGIDRVELAYARHLLAAVGDTVGFAGMSAVGRFGPLPATGARRLIRSLEAQWRGDRSATEATLPAVSLARQLQVWLSIKGEQALHARERAIGSESIYLLVSHHHLDVPAPIRRLKERAGASFVCLIHDVIPIEYPEYARPGQADRHRRRIDTVAELADAVVVNSESTRAALEPLLRRPHHREIPILTAPLGIEAVAPESAKAAAAGSQPYFICISTIEPKKNHLLLLNVWRRLALAHGGETPRLILVGHRGWENENVVDMIERSAPLQGLVEEHRGLSDSEMHRLLAGARALLMPSFAEGYGLPIGEALIRNVPVLCSDLSAFREVGRDVPEYLDPLDGPDWCRAIMDYARSASPRRDAQMVRMTRWRAPRWEDHFAAFDRFMGLSGEAASPGLRTALTGE